MINYIKETQNEMKHVSWPTKRQVVTFTILVIIISLVISFFLGFFDGVFKSLLEKFILSRI
jgi:preprotein translocase SecE subunit